jgi:electron transfer flavoprotein alpha subunit
MVYVQLRGEGIAGVSLELVSEARRLADQLGTGVSAAIFGVKAAGEAERLGELGADRVYLFEDLRLRYYTPIPYAKLLVRVIQEGKPQIVLLGATTEGRDLAPRVASALRVGLTADVTGLKLGDYTQNGREYKNILYQYKPAFGNNIVAAIVSPGKNPQMTTVREGVMRMGVPDPSRKAELIRVSACLEEADFPSEVLERVMQERNVKLRGAELIVAGGIGVGSREGFGLIRELAETLGGEVGATRAATDAGYIGPEHLIGQTGTTVRPKLYIACGISGAIQHLAGMDGSSRIIAVNTDPDAPIFKIAHYGIVGDLLEVIPRMIRAYKVRA